MKVQLVFTMTWKESVYKKVIAHCNQTGSRTFSLQAFMEAWRSALESEFPNNQHIEAKIRQQLQFLRNDALISFLDNTGNYTLRGVDLLDGEKQETATINLTQEAPEKREYLVETYVRHIKWVKQAIAVYGFNCLYQNCSNTFLREDGIPYIEVHHIIPLCRGGEDSLWNLSVLCAHHHRMAHFSDLKTQIAVEKFLLKAVSARI